MLTIILIIILLTLNKNSRGDAYNYTDNNSTCTVNETGEEMLIIVLIITILTLNKTVEEMLTIILIITLLILLTKQ